MASYGKSLIENLDEYSIFELDKTSNSSQIF